MDGIGISSPHRCREEWSAVGEAGGSQNGYLGQKGRAEQRLPTEWAQRVRPPVKGLRAAATGLGTAGTAAETTAETATAAAEATGKVAKARARRAVQYSGMDEDKAEESEDATEESEDSDEESNIEDKRAHPTVASRKDSPAPLEKALVRCSCTLTSSHDGSPCVFLLNQKQWCRPITPFAAGRTQPPPAECWCGAGCCRSRATGCSGGGSTPDATTHRCADRSRRPHPHTNLMLLLVLKKGTGTTLGLKTRTRSRSNVS